MATIVLKPDKKYKVGKIICVGRNYQKHINEMSSEKPKKPVLFLKPSTAIINEDKPIILPSFSNEIHHEIELALLINNNAKSIQAADWKNYVAGAAVALDLTLRDHQSDAKKKGLPWSVSKGFDGACPVGTFVPLDDIGEFDNLTIQLFVNDQLRQKGNTGQMLFKPGELLEYISFIFTLEKGDLILTGTPSGVGPLNHGDKIKGMVENVGKIDFKVE